MHDKSIEDSEELFIASLDEGRLGNEYSVVGIVNEGAGEPSGTDFELFIVRSGSDP